jgi:hypothetical protein
VHFVPKKDRKVRGHLIRIEFHGFVKAFLSLNTHGCGDGLGGGLAAATDANQPTFLVSLHDKHGRLYNVEQNFKEFYELMTFFYFSIQSEAFMLLYSTDNPVKLVDNAIKSNPFILAAFQKCMPNLEQVRYFEIDFEESKLALAANVLLDFLLLKFSNVNNLHRFSSIYLFFIMMIFFSSSLSILLLHHS